MEKVFALRVMRFCLSRFKTLISGIEIAFQNEFAISQRPGIHRTSLYDTYRESLDCSGCA
jgi:hypothetical protein